MGVAALWHQTHCLLCEIGEFEIVPLGSCLLRFPYGKLDLILQLSTRRLPKGLPPPRRYYTSALFTKPKAAIGLEVSAASGGYLVREESRHSGHYHQGFATLSYLLAAKILYTARITPAIKHP